MWNKLNNIWKKTKPHNIDCKQTLVLTNAKTVLTHHSIITGHAFNFKDVKILDQEKLFQIIF